MTVAAKTGLNHVFLRNSGTYGSPVWNVINVVKDLTLGLKKVMADAAARVSSVKQKLPNLKEIDLEYEIIRDTAGPDFVVLQNAYWNDTTLDIAVADGPIATSGTRYFRCDTVLSDFSEKQPLENTVMVSVKHEPVYSSNVPGFFVAP
jgi:hypothetical protein